MNKKELQQLIKEEITKQSFNKDTMKKEELQKLQEALTDVMKYQMDEPDHEGEMAKSQMLKTMKYAADIMNMIDDTTELPAWVQSKLTKIASYIGAVKHHMESKTVRHVVTNMMESEDIKLGDLINESVVSEAKPKTKQEIEYAINGLENYLKKNKYNDEVKKSIPPIIKKLQAQLKSVKEQSSNRDIIAISTMTGVPDYKIEDFVRKHKLKDLKKVKKLVKGMGVKKDERFAQIVDGKFSAVRNFVDMYKDS